ncbi:MAG: VWA domain-containing protein [Clostridia bacterium]|nr:VWA domain-containing protein [Clostridia bacterium]
MKNNITEIVFILDKSGSMAGLESDTVGGFNATLEKQKGKEGKAYVSTVLFNNTSEVVHDRIDINEIAPMTREDYRVGGMTALYDAIGDAIHHIGNIHKYAREEDVPEHTVFIITTDGMENSSIRYSRREIKEKIERQQKKYGWEFIFLAANIDAAECAEDIGIRRDRAVNYIQDPTGVKATYETMSDALFCMRSGGSLDNKLWRKKLDEDGKRSKRK